MEAKKQVSIEDVARAAGVAQSTVSKTLNRTTQSRRPTEAQLRIRRVAEELGYRPNHTARSLSKGRTDIVGLYCPFGFDTLDPFFAQFVNGIRAGCRRHHKDVLVHGKLHEHPLHDLYEELTDGKTDGLVMYPEPTDVAVAERLSADRFPTVTMAIRMPGLPVVRVDSESGSRLAVEHLAACGHRRLLYRNVMAGNETDGRFAAFAASADGHGIPYVETHAVSWNGELGPEEMALLSLPAHRRPTAAVCFNDTYAYQLLAHCRRVGITVPDDLAVVGFDGAGSWHVHQQQLTTIVAPWDRAAEIAVDLLIDRLDGTEIPMETVLPVTWRSGETA